jgi:hypothetical protein
MTLEIEKLFTNASDAKALLRVNAISYEEAKRRIMPYIDMWNKISMEKARKFHVSPKKISFASFIR